MLLAPLQFLLIAMVSSLSYVSVHLPRRPQIAAMASLWSVLLRYRRRFRIATERNLSLVFPELSDEQRDILIHENAKVLGRLSIDALQSFHLPDSWYREHVSWPNQAQFFEYRNRYAPRGILVASAHFGSFEMLPAAASALGYNLDFVARPLTLRHLENWFRSKRERTGNRVISREKAALVGYRALKKGRDLGVLFDQNVTRRNAVFVPLFGKPAATTKMLAALAFKLKTGLALSYLNHVRDDHYEIVILPIEVDDVYSGNLDDDEVVRELTRRAQAALEGVIKEQPQGWFWMHRRWKTRPEGENENFYSEGS